MNLYTLADAKTDRGLKTVIAKSPSSDEYLQYLNSSMRMLRRRGDWRNTVASARFCSYDNCIVWPGFVGSVRALNVCDNPTPILNHWYEFMRFGSGALKGCSSGCGADEDSVVVMRGYVPVLRNIACGESRYIRCYTTYQNDIGKIIRFYGLDENGQPVMTKNSSNVWTEGMDVTLALPYASTACTFSKITKVVKAETEGRVNVFQYDADNDLLVDVAMYEPKDVLPAYQYSVLSGALSCSCQGSCSSRHIDVSFKFSEQPVANDTDVLPIQNMEAIKLMIMAIKKEEAGDFEGARKEELGAVKEMNLDTADEFPKYQTPVTVSPFGTARLERKSIGRMI